MNDGRASRRSRLCVLLLGANLGACGTSGKPEVLRTDTADSGVPDGAGAPDDASPETAEELAADAFVWGFPLVVSQRTFQFLGGLVGVNQLFNQAALSNETTRIIVAPNQDTLYSVAVLDLRSEPMVLTVPDVQDRYWVYQFLDAWTNSFRYIGTRATSGKGGTFAITPPGWTGTLPDGSERVESPTPELFLLGRYLVQDAADVPNVVALTRTLRPLSAVLGTTAPAAPPPLGMAPGTPQTVGTDSAFYDELGDVLAVNPPASADDEAALKRFAEMGIGPGLHPTAAARDAGDSAALDALDAGVVGGADRIQSTLDALTGRVNGWATRLDIGTYTDPLVRATVAKFAWGANVPEESVYPVSKSDATGEAYTGARGYVMHFDGGRLPPVDATRGFWSLTLYGPDMFFVGNSLQRFAIGDRTPGLVYGTDGSLDLYIGSTAPVGHESNWLPAPPGEFNLMMRLYLPEQSVLEGTYEYPAVTPVN